MDSDVILVESPTNVTYTQYVQHSVNVAVNMMVSVHGYVFLVSWKSLNVWCQTDYLMTGLILVHWDQSKGEKVSNQAVCFSTPWWYQRLNSNDSCLVCFKCTTAWFLDSPLWLVQVWNVMERRCGSNKWTLIQTWVLVLFEPWLRQTIQWNQERKWTKEKMQCIMGRKNKQTIQLETDRAGVDEVKVGEDLVIRWTHLQSSVLISPGQSMVRTKAWFLMVFFFLMFLHLTIYSSLPQHAPLPQDVFATTSPNKTQSDVTRPFICEAITCKCILCLTTLCCSDQVSVHWGAVYMLITRCCSQISRSHNSYTGWETVVKTMERFFSFQLRHLFTCSLMRLDCNDNVWPQDFRCRHIAHHRHRHTGSDAAKTLVATQWKQCDVCFSLHFFGHKGFRCLKTYCQTSMTSMSVRSEHRGDQGFDDAACANLNHAHILGGCIVERVLGITSHTEFVSVLVWM